MKPAMVAEKIGAWVFGGLIGLGVALAVLLMCALLLPTRQSRDP